MEVECSHTTRRIEVEEYFLFVVRILRGGGGGSVCVVLAARHLMQECAAHKSCIECSFSLSYQHE